MEHWKVHFKPTSRHNLAHTLVDALVYAGEVYRKDIRVRLYPNPIPNDPKSIIGVLQVDSQTVLSVRYTRNEGPMLYPARPNLGARQYDWDWLGGRFTLDRIKKLLSSNRLISRVGSLRDVYEGYVRDLGITEEEESRLRSNLATAAFYTVKADRTPQEVTGIIQTYLDALGLKKEELTFELKLQLIIATYEVAKEGKDESLGKCIDHYTTALGDPKDLSDDLKKQWLIATYNVAMKGGHEVLKTILEGLGKHPIFSGSDPGMKGDLLILTSHWVKLPNPIQAVDRFVTLFSQSSNPAQFVRDCRNQAYRMVIGAADRMPEPNSSRSLEPQV